MNAVMEINFNLDTAAVSDRGLNDKRPYNEDSYLEIAAKGLFAVADGVGGAQAGDVASQMAVEILGEAFVHYADTVDAEEIMKVAIERANSAIYQMASDLPQLSSMATTIVAVHLSGNIATIAHVGDSRLYHVDIDGNLFRDTNDHSVVEEEVRAGRMTPEQALNHPSRNVISRALGAEPNVLIDQKTIMVEPGTNFLLCSDGVTRHITDEEIAGLLTTGMSAKMTCDQIKEICYSRGAEDNLTAIVVKLSSEQEAAATRDLHSSDADEYATLASVRSPFDAPAAISSTGLGNEQNLSNVESHLEHKEQSEESAYNSSSVVVEANTQTTDNDDFSIFGNSATSKPEESHEVSRSSSSTSRIFNSILFLMLGAVVGIGGYYFWQSSSPTAVPQPTVITPKSSDIFLENYEESRRKVDSDPESFVLGAGSTTPSDAIDFYYLGRALLLTGKAPEARQQFILAKEKLGEADDRIRDTLTADINIGLALVSSLQSVEALKKELAESSTPKADNTNTAANLESQNTNMPAINP